MTSFAHAARNQVHRLLHPEPKAMVRHHAAVPVQRDPLSLFVVRKVLADLVDKLVGVGIALDLFADREERL
jgi:hypothetical protein